MVNNENNIRPDGFNVSLKPSSAQKAGRVLLVAIEIILLLGATLGGMYYAHLQGIHSIVILAGIGTAGILTTTGLSIATISLCCKSHAKNIELKKATFLKKEGIPQSQVNNILLNLKKRKDQILMISAVSELGKFSKYYLEKFDFVEFINNTPILENENDLQILKQQIRLNKLVYNPYNQLSTDVRNKIQGWSAEQISNLCDTLEKYEIQGTDASACIHYLSSNFSDSNLNDFISWAPTLAMLNKTAAGTTNFIFKKLIESEIPHNSIKQWFEIVSLALENKAEKAHFFPADRERLRFFSLLLSKKFSFEEAKKTYGLIEKWGPEEFKKLNQILSDCNDEKFHQIINNLNIKDENGRANINRSNIDVLYSVYKAYSKIGEQRFNLMSEIMQNPTFDRIKPDYAFRLVQIYAQQKIGTSILEKQTDVYAHVKNDEECLAFFSLLISKNFSLERAIHVHGLIQNWNKLPLQQLNEILSDCIQKHGEKFDQLIKDLTIKDKNDRTKIHKFNIDLLYKAYFQMGEQRFDLMNEIMQSPILDKKRNELDWCLVQIYAQQKNETSILEKQSEDLTNLQIDPESRKFFALLTSKNFSLEKAIQTYRLTEDWPKGASDKLNEILSDCDDEKFNQIINNLNVKDKNGRNNINKFNIDLLHKVYFEMGEQRFDLMNEIMQSPSLDKLRTQLSHSLVQIYNKETNRVISLEKRAEYFVKHRIEAYLPKNFTEEKYHQVIQIFCLFQENKLGTEDIQTILKALEKTESEKWPSLLGFLLIAKDSRSSSFNSQIVNTLKRFSVEQLNQGLHNFNTHFAEHLIIDGKINPEIKIYSFLALLQLLTESPKEELPLLLERIGDLGKESAIAALAYIMHPKENRSEAWDFYNAIKMEDPVQKVHLLLVDALLPLSLREDFVENFIKDKERAKNDKLLESDEILTGYLLTKMTQNELHYSVIKEHWQNILLKEDQSFESLKLASWIHKHLDILGLPSTISSNDGVNLHTLAVNAINPAAIKGPLKFHMNLLKKRNERVTLEQIQPISNQIAQKNIQLQPDFFAKMVGQFEIDLESIPNITTEDLDLLVKELTNFNQKNLQENQIKTLQYTIEILTVKDEKNKPIDKLEFFKGVLSLEKANVLSAQLKCILNFVKAGKSENKENELSERNQRFLNFLEAVQNCHGGKEQGIRDFYRESIPDEYKLKTIAGESSQEPIVLQLMNQIETAMLSIISEDTFYKKLLEIEKFGQLQHQTKYVLNLASDLLGIKHNINYDIYSGVVIDSLAKMSLQEFLNRFYKTVEPQDLIDKIKQQIASRSKDKDFHQKIVLPTTKFLLADTNFGKELLKQGALEKNLEPNQEAFEEIWEYSDDEDDFSFTPVGIKDEWIALLLQKIGALKTV